MTGPITLTEERRRQFAGKLRYIASAIDRLNPYRANELDDIAVLIETDQPPEWCEWSREGADWKTGCGGYAQVALNGECPICGKPVREGGK